MSDGYAQVEPEIKPTYQRGTAARGRVGSGNFCLLWGKLGIIILIAFLIAFGLGCFQEQACRGAGEAHVGGGIGHEVSTPKESAPQGFLLSFAAGGAWFFGSVFFGDRSSRCRSGQTALPALRVAFQVKALLRVGGRFKEQNEMAGRLVLLVFFVIGISLPAVFEHILHPRA